MLIGWVLAGAARAECPEDALVALRDNAAQIEQNYLEMQPDALQAAHRALRGVTPCVAAPLDTSDALLLHRSEALAAYIGEDPSASRRSWLAVRDLSPDWAPNPDLMPPGHPLEALWSTPRDTPPRDVPQTHAPIGGWRIDGTAQNSVPADRAYVVQAIGRDGEVLYTGYHLRPDQMTAVPVDLAPSPARPGASTTRRRVHVAGSALSGGLAIGGVGALALVPGYNHRATTTTDDLRSTEYLRRAHNSAIVGGVLLGTGVALGVTTWTVQW